MQNSGMNAQNGVICGKALHDAELVKNLRHAGIAPHFLGPREFAAFFRAEHDKWGKVVRDTGATVN